MTLHRLALAFLLSAPFLPACSATEEEEEEEAAEVKGPNVDCDMVTVPKYGEVAAFDKCTHCHSTDKAKDERNGAPLKVNYNTYKVARANAAKGMEEVYEGKMPPADYPQFKLTEAEKTQLYNWASCGTPK